MKSVNRVAAAVAAAVVLATAAATADDAPGLKLPEDLTAAGPGESTAPGEEARGLQYHETRIGGRLERVTVTRENGWTETYRNNRADTIWRAPENEIGESANLRRWVIRVW